VVKVLCYKLEGRWFDSRFCHWNFSFTSSFRPHCGPAGVDSASNRNVYQEYFLGVKSGRCIRLTTLPPSCAVVMKSGNLNFLETSGHFGPVMGLIYLYLPSSVLTYSIAEDLVLSTFQGSFFFHICTVHPAIIKVFCYQMMHTRIFCKGELQFTLKLQ